MRGLSELRASTLLFARSHCCGRGKRQSAFLVHDLEELQTFSDKIVRKAKGVRNKIDSA